MQILNESVWNEKKKRRKFYFSRVFHSEGQSLYSGKASSFIVVFLYFWAAAEQKKENRKKSTDVVNALSHVFVI